MINLVSEDSIEHRMLSLLEQKRSLAEGVVDGKGKNEMGLPSGRAAFLERLDALMTGETKEPPTPPTDPIDRLRDDILSQWSNQLELMELHGEGEQQTLLVVADRMDEALQEYPHPATARNSSPTRRRNCNCWTGMPSRPSSN